MNNSPAVSPHTADAVRRAVKEIGYSLPPRQRRMRRDGIAGGPPPRHRSIALLFPDPKAAAMKTVLSGRLAHGINEVLAKRELNFLMASLAAPDRMPACIEKRQVDGVIIRGTVPLEGLLPLVQPLRCVTVFEMPRVPSYGDQVLEDNTLVGEMAVAYLRDKGCGRVACLNAAVMHAPSAARADAFLRAARLAGVEAKAFAAAVPHAELVEQFVAASPRPDGLFIAGNDIDVLSVYVALSKQGVVPGRDVKLICTPYDPARIHALDAALDYIDIRPEAIGRAAAEMLLWRFENPVAPQRRQLVAPAFVPAGTLRA